MLTIPKPLAVTIVLAAMAKSQKGGPFVPLPPPGHPTFEDPTIPEPLHVPKPPIAPESPHVPGPIIEAVPTIKYQYLCGEDNGEIYDDGVNKFELKCDYGAYVGDLTNHESTTLKECVELCAKNVACFAADWDWNNSVCHIKGEEFPGSPNSEHHQWYPVGDRKLRSCPIDRLSEPKPDPLIVTDPKCPDGMFIYFIRY
ncbi:hypothetical protein N7493_007367 [Penicillium malachiteum]|uniref:Apple domain-containing protein n=1 Tax=Penicillium malachiteum TaxID=1324776 RepID=A0AAD6HJ77_9EURO|nr:hypothetical protein N7493_007367 [Penicillium malachiteum]